MRLANEQIEVAILSALFKSAKAKATEAGNPRASLLRLAMIWDRFDIAKAQIFGEATTSASSDAAVDENENNPVWLLRLYNTISLGEVELLGKHSSGRGYFKDEKYCYKYLKSGDVISLLISHYSVECVVALSPKNSQIKKRPSVVSVLLTAFLEKSLKK